MRMTVPGEGTPGVAEAAGAGAASGKNLGQPRDGRRGRRRCPAGVLPGGGHRIGESDLARRAPGCGLVRPSFFSDLGELGRGGRAVALGQQLVRVALGLRHTRVRHGGDRGGCRGDIGLRRSHPGSGGLGPSPGRAARPRRGRPSAVDDVHPLRLAGLLLGPIEVPGGHQLPGLLHQDVVDALARLLARPVVLPKRGRDAGARGRRRRPSRDCLRRSRSSGSTT